MTNGQNHNSVIHAASAPVLIVLMRTDFPSMSSDSCLAQASLLHVE